MILSAVAPPEKEVSASDSAFVWLRDRPEEAAEFRDSLRELGRAAVIVDDPLIPEVSLGGVVRALQLAEVTAISARAALADSTKEDVKEIVGARFLESLEDASRWLEASSNTKETQ
jgi:bifunctional enzyme CysN/CysC/sulfate adenylyltransferase subunit 1